MSQTKRIIKGERIPEGSQSKSEGLIVAGERIPELYVPTEKDISEGCKWLYEAAFNPNYPPIGFEHLKLFLQYFVFTMDEHDHSNPFKRLPLNTKPYLLKVAKAWLENDLMVVYKSRQTMMTWLISACFLWDAMFKKGRLNIIVSKKENDADEVLTRIKGIYSRLYPREFWHGNMPTKRSPGSELGSYCKLEFLHNKSRIIGLSQNPDDIKGFTASNIFSDEVAAQERARETFVAMKPTLDGGGRYVAVSTPKGRNYFYNMVHDPNNGFHKMRVHYSEDLLKDNEAWLSRAKAGLSDDEWQQEQEINFTRAGGNAMYPTFSHQVHVKELQAVKHRPLLCGLDFGYRHPALVVAQKSETDQLCILREYMPSDIEVLEFGKRCLFILKTDFPWHFANRQHYINWYCDPAGTQRNDKSEKTSIQLLRERLNIFCRFKRLSILEGVAIVRNLLLRRSDSSPGLLIDPSCRILIEGFMGGYEEQESKDGMEAKELPKSDNHFSHTQDALRYIVTNSFNAFTKPNLAAKWKVDEYDPFSDDNLPTAASRQEQITGYTL